MRDTATTLYVEAGPHRVGRASSAGRMLVRCAGVILLVLTGLPVYRLLAHTATGLAGEMTVEQLDIYYDFTWSGTLLALPVAVLAALFLPHDRVAQWLRAVGDWLIARPQPRLAVIMAILAAVLSAGFAIVFLEGKPNLIDGISQMLHARFWADGRLAGPATDHGGFWAIQNALFTPRGWVSQYPPGHVAVLALSVTLGLPWLGNAILTGVTVFMTSLLAERLLGRTVEARLGSILLAISVFFICLAGSFMNHVTSAAAVATAAYAWTRAWQGGVRWAYLAGFAFGFAFLTRPWSALVAALALVPTIAIAVAGRPTLPKSIALLGRLTAGGLPPLLVLLFYNTYFFGHPLNFGYNVALGPAMGLGFHQDPWGNTYGIREAVGYTSSDLITLSANLFETPVPALLIIGCFLVWSPVLKPGERVFACWAGAAVVGNFFYWHHGIFMGPRMLHESAPAWVVLFAISAVGLYRRLSGRQMLHRFDLQSSYVSAMFFAFALGILYLAPQRAASYGGGWLDITRIEGPEVSESAVVFVHDGWMGRIAMQLASGGMRLDEVETAIRQNSTCTLQQYVDAIDAGDSQIVELIRELIDLEPRVTRLPPSVYIATGDYYRRWPGDVMTADCLRQAASDRRGIVDIAPLLAQGNLPGVPGTRVLIVRDLGPEKNQRLLRQYPTRRAFVYASPRDLADPVLMPYDDGMQTLWGGY